MDSLLTWGLLLVAASVLLVVAEVFIPSMGALSIGAAAAAIGGIVCLFRYDAEAGTQWGFVGVGLILLLIPSAIFFAMKFWPHTKLGRRIIGTPSDEERERQLEAELAERRRRDALIGQEARVVVDLRPVGTVELNGERYEAVSDSGFIDRGKAVRVVKIDGGSLRVRGLA